MNKLEELKSKLEKAKTNKVLTESQRQQLISRYTEEIDVLEKEPPVSAKKEKPKSKPKKEGKVYSPSDKDCEEIIKENEKKARKAKESAKKSAKKSPTTKSKDKIDKVEDSVIGRVKAGTATKAEIKALIKKTKELLDVLEAALNKL